MTQKITVEKRGYILLIGLNRPEKRNAFDVDMYWDLAKAYGMLDADEDLRCGVLFAHGDHFTG
ncbi:MAG TPA: enoyl-CoA hydratase, partial [Spirochaetota bacterium]|nr:enoyl-CoA hydratase [Spirochaetota bacterium]HRR62141.1 enoyl-CoA hydratase [Spirochaetota bacterium]